MNANSPRKLGNAFVAVFFYLFQQVIVLHLDFDKVILGLGHPTPPSRLLNRYQSPA
jgi:hypothetical protein